IYVNENDILPSITNGVRSLNISKEFKEKLYKPWMNTVIIRLMDKIIGYSFLCNRLRSLWRPLGNMHIIDLDMEYFMVRFGNERDCG
ncbi:hypothetical protein LINPERHAP1_LOCUS28138, partial [Linum perenne]